MWSTFWLPILQHKLIPHDSPSMPTVLSNGDCEEVIDALKTKPTLRSLVDHYNWVLRLITALFHYVTFFMGDNADQIQKLEFRIQELEEKSQSQPTQLTHPTPTPQQPARPTRSIRCQRCHVIGHGTNDCRTKDPVAVKKRVSNNQKARKRAVEQSQLPPIGSPYYGPTLLGDPLFIHNPPPSSQALMALAADVKELRRRKVQSMRDKHHSGATTTTSK